ncbi:hypothetical protein AY599_07815 [Leptolyngbya valderiana BDU 20041]|nr:hypothetical protein AY599_07815 [Leptolyngbya valderiana BDU 20041]
MPRFPTNEAAFIAYAKQRSDQWKGGQAGPPDVGLSAQQLTDTENAADEAQAAYTAMLAARNAAREATLLKNNKLEALRAIFGGDVDTIDAYAKATGNPDVWVLAGIPKPKDPGERPAPPKPTELELTALTGGSIVIDFKVAAAGAVFEVQRRSRPIGGTAGDWTTIAITGEKHVTDPGVPVGLESVEYKVRAVLPNNNAGLWSDAKAFYFGAQGSQGGPAAREKAG